MTGGISKSVVDISLKFLLSPQVLTEVPRTSTQYPTTSPSTQPSTIMDPSQQFNADAPSAAEPPQATVEERLPESTQEQPIPPVQPMEHPAPTSVNVQETSPEPTASRAGFDHGYNSDSKAHYYSRSADFNPSAPEYAPQDLDQAAPFTSSPSVSQQPQLHPSSRPSSSFSNGPERHSLSQPQPSESAQRQAAQSSKNSVVIKVGMVGDAQIGKTSLMVKYVEGSWDEDYIQTLGAFSRCCSIEIGSNS